MSDQDAADAAVDPDRLFPTEDPSTTRVDDATHWIAVYEELLTAKLRMVGVTEEQIERSDHADARSELGIDQRLLTAEMRRFQRRLAFWRHRARRLAGDEA